MLFSLCWYLELEVLSQIFLQESSIALCQLGPPACICGFSWELHDSPCLWASSLSLGLKFYLKPLGGGGTSNKPVV